jgi:hypothetical protein
LIIGILDLKFVNMRSKTPETIDPSVFFANSEPIPSFNHYILG